jgi:hypothetical protein
VTDTRRVCDLTAGELLDAAWAQLAGIGVTAGAWSVRAYVVDGHTRSIQPEPGGGRPVTIGRGELERLDREFRSGQ